MQKTPQLRLSLWDMLDENPEHTHRHRPLTWHENVHQLMESVRQNIDSILNTRRLTEPVPPEFEYCQNSILAFGLPDFTSFAVTSAEDKGLLALAMETAIRRFEPRLGSVVVTLVNLTKEQQSSQPTTIVRYRIQGRLRTEPAPEQVGFDTTLEADRWHFELVGVR